jgi:uncharacterized protein
MKIIEQIKEIAMDLSSSNRGCHGFDHSERVYELCRHIGKREKADVEVLSIASYLHDIGRIDQDKSNGRICHAEAGAKKAREILANYNLSKEKINNIIHCIEVHRFRGSNKPKTLEAKILRDADKLDAIGAVGIGRVFFFASEVGAYLHNKDVDIKKTKPYTKEDTAYREFLVKLKFIKNEIITKEGKKIAKGRHQFMINFFNRINKEVTGEL